MNPSRVASAYTAQSDWLVDLANEVAETIVRESYFHTRLLRVEPFSVGVEAAFESPDYGVNSIFFSLEREDILDVSLQRLGQTSFRVRVDLSRPVQGRVVQQVIQWVRNETFDKNVHLGAAAPTPDFKREVDTALRAGNYTFGDYRFRDGGVEADVQVFLSLRTLPSAVVQEAVRALPAPQQATAWQGYIENNSVEDVISEVEFGNIPLEFVPASVQLRLAPKFLYENRARVSLEVLVGSLDGLRSATEQAYSEMGLETIQRLIARDYFRVAPVDEDGANPEGFECKWSVSGGVLTFEHVMSEWWADTGGSMPLRRAFQKGTMEWAYKEEVPAGVPAKKNSAGIYEVNAQYSQRVVGLPVSHLYWEDHFVWKYDLVAAGRQVVEDLVALRARA